MILKPEPGNDPGCLLPDSIDKATTCQPRFKEEEEQTPPLSGGVAYLHKGEELIDSGCLYFRDKLPPMDTTYAFHVDINFARCLLIRLLPLEMMPQLGANLVAA